jgi:Uma2 family endonuclease
MREIEVRRWTRREYERMAETGILGPGERVELLDGEVVRVTPQGGPHARAIRAAEEALRAVFHPGHDVRVQLPLALGSFSLPEPDLSVVPGSWRDYRLDHPGSAVLVVEVAGTTLALDRMKGGLYAEAGVPDYWIVDLTDRRLEVCRDPRPRPDARYGWEYASVQILGPGERVAPLAAGGAAVTVDDLLA